MKGTNIKIPTKLTQTKSLSLITLLSSFKDCPFHPLPQSLDKPCQWIDHMTITLYKLTGEKEELTGSTLGTLQKVMAGER